MAIQITKKTSTANTTSASGRAIKYIVIHYTAGVTSKAGAAANTAGWFMNPSASASADFIVDDATIIQCNPDIVNRYCWHCGGSKYNNKGGSLYGVAKNSNSIGIEICSTNSTGKMTNANDKYYSYTDAVVSRAAELVKYLMGTYGIKADQVIRHYDVNGKPCPGIIGWNADSGDESKWRAFKVRLGNTGTGSSPAASLYRVRKSWGDTKSQKGAFMVWDNAKKCADENAGYSVFNMNGKVVYYGSSSGVTTSLLPYQVRVKIADLNIRKGPSTDHAKTGKYTGIGTFTIVEEQSGQGSTAGWGKLKSGAGWISLDYCTKV